ncbi:MAG: ParB/RepB/Spo0J family partition protein, partial [Pseudomonadota bacterium]
AKKIRLEKVPAVGKHATDRDKMIMAVIENIQRENLNCVEEALAYFQLMDDFKITQEELAKKLGKERSTLANYLRILNLPRPVIELLQSETLTFGHAKVLAALKDEEKILRVANKAALENLSVREVEEYIKEELNPSPPKVIRNPFFDEKIDQLRQKLEQRTGFHLSINTKKNGTGQVLIKFNNEAEFNDIYDYLIKSRGENGNS